jgi:hypothetical protein
MRTMEPRIKKKTCTKCGKKKSITEFYHRTKAQDGYDTKCKSCKNEERKLYPYSKRRVNGTET